MNIVISDATPDDAQEIIALMNRIGGESDNLTFGKDEFFVSDPADEAAFIEQQAASGGFTLLAREERGRKRGGPRIIGSISVDVGGRPRLRHRGVLGMSVLKEFWGQGVGTRLLQRALGRVENEQGIEVLSLEVRCDNERAIRLYERFGFERTGIDRGILKVDDKLCDAYLMSRVFHRAQAEEGRALFYLGDVLDAVDSAGEGMEWYACLDTGEVVGRFEDFDDWTEEDEEAFDPSEAEGGWVALPDRYDVDDMRCMRDFARLQDDALCQRLLDVTHRRGAYRNFKDECARHGLLNDYYACRERRHREVAIAWLEDHGCLWTEGCRPQR